jgi:hypothetical protein
VRHPQAAVAVRDLDCGNKKGRGEIAPAFLIIVYHQCQYIRGQKL